MTRHGEAKEKGCGESGILGGFVTGKWEFSTSLAQKNGLSLHRADFSMENQHGEFILGWLC